jgi:hypothetical protein
MLKKNYNLEKIIQALDKAVILRSRIERETSPIKLQNDLEKTIELLNDSFINFESQRAMKKNKRITESILNKIHACF